MRLSSIVYKNSFRESASSCEGICKSNSEDHFYTNDNQAIRLWNFQKQLKAHHIPVGTEERVVLLSESRINSEILLVLASKTDDETPCCIVRKLKSSFLKSYELTIENVSAKYAALSPDKSILLIIDTKNQLSLYDVRVLHKSKKSKRSKKPITASTITSSQSLLIDGGNSIPANKITGIEFWSNNQIVLWSISKVFIFGSAVNPLIPTDEEESETSLVTPDPSSIASLAQSEAYDIFDADEEDSQWSLEQEEEEVLELEEVVVKPAYWNPFEYQLAIDLAVYLAGREEAGSPRSPQTVAESVTCLKAVPSPIGNILIVGFSDGMIRLLTYDLSSSAGMYPIHLLQFVAHQDNQPVVAINGLIQNIYAQCIHRPLYSLEILSSGEDGRLCHWGILATQPPIRVPRENEALSSSSIISGYNPSQTIVPEFTILDCKWSVDLQGSYKFQDNVSFTLDSRMSTPFTGNGPPKKMTVNVKNDKPLRVKQMLVMTTTDPASKIPPRMCICCLRGLILILEIRNPLQQLFLANSTHPSQLTKGTFKADNFTCRNIHISVGPMILTSMSLQQFMENTAVIPSEQTDGGDGPDTLSSSFGSIIVLQDDNSVAFLSLIDGSILKQTSMLHIHEDKPLPLTLKMEESKHAQDLECTKFPSCLHWCMDVKNLIIGYRSGTVGILPMTSIESEKNKTSAEYMSPPRQSTIPFYLPTTKTHTSSIVEIVSFVLNPEIMTSKKFLKSNSQAHMNRLFLILGDETGVLSLWSKKVNQKSSEFREHTSIRIHQGGIVAIRIYRIPTKQNIEESKMRSRNPVLYTTDYETPAIFSSVHAVTACRNGLVHVWRVEHNGSMDMLACIHCCSALNTTLTAFAICPFVQTLESNAELSTLTLYCMCGFSNGVVECWPMSPAGGKGSDAPIANTFSSRLHNNSVIDMQPVCPQAVSHISKSKPKQHMVFCPCSVEKKSSRRIVYLAVSCSTDGSLWLMNVFDDGSCQPLNKFIAHGASHPALPLSPMFGTAPDSAHPATDTLVESRNKVVNSQRNKTVPSLLANSNTLTSMLIHEMPVFSQPTKEQGTLGFVSIEAVCMTSYGVCKVLLTSIPLCFTENNNQSFNEKVCFNVASIPLPPSVWRNPPPSHHESSKDRKSPSASPTFEPFCPSDINDEVILKSFSAMGRSSRNTDVGASGDDDDGPTFIPYPTEVTAAMEVALAKAGDNKSMTSATSADVEPEGNTLTNTQSSLSLTHGDSTYTEDCAELMIQLHLFKKDPILLARFVQHPSTRDGTISVDGVLDVVHNWFPSELSVSRDHVESLINLLDIKIGSRLQFLEVAKIASIVCSAVDTSSSLSGASQGQTHNNKSSQQIQVHQQKQKFGLGKTTSNNRVNKRFKDMNTTTTRVTYNSMGEKVIEKVHKKVLPTHLVEGLPKGFCSKLRKFWYGQHARIDSNVMTKTYVNAFQISDDEEDYGQLIVNLDPTRGATHPNIILTEIPELFKEMIHKSCINKKILYWKPHEEHWLSLRRTMRIARTVMDSQAAEQHAYMHAAGPNTCFSKTISSIISLEKLVLKYFERNYGGQYLNVAHRKMVMFLEACLQYSDYPLLYYFTVALKLDPDIDRESGKGDNVQRTDNLALTSLWLYIEMRELVSKRGLMIQGDVITEEAPESDRLDSLAFEGDISNHPLTATSTKNNSLVVHWQLVTRTDAMLCVEEMIRGRGGYGPKTSDRIVEAIKTLPLVECSSVDDNECVDCEAFCSMIALEYIRIENDLRNMEDVVYRNNLYEQLMTLSEDTNTHPHLQEDIRKENYSVSYSRIDGLMLQFVNVDKERTGCVDKDCFYDIIMTLGQYYLGYANELEVRKLLSLCVTRYRDAMDGTICYLDIWTIFITWLMNSFGSDMFCCKIAIDSVLTVEKTIDEYHATTLIAFLGHVQCLHRRDTYWMYSKSSLGASWNKDSSMKDRMFSPTRGINKLPDTPNGALTDSQKISHEGVWDTGDVMKNDFEVGKLDALVNTLIFDPNNKSERLNTRGHEYNHMKRNAMSDDINDFSFGMMEVVKPAGGKSRGGSRKIAETALPVDGKDWKRDIIQQDVIPQQVCDKVVKKVDDLGDLKHRIQEQNNQRIPRVLLTDRNFATLHGETIAPVFHFGGKYMRSIIVDSTNKIVSNNTAEIRQMDMSGHVMFPHEEGKVVPQLTPSVEELDVMESRSSYHMDQQESILTPYDCQPPMPSESQPPMLFDVPSMASTSVAMIGSIEEPSRVSQENTIDEILVTLQVPESEKGELVAVPLPFVENAAIPPAQLPEQIQTLDGDAQNNVFTNKDTSMVSALNTSAPDNLMDIEPVLRGTALIDAEKKRLAALVAENELTEKINAERLFLENLRKKKIMGRLLEKKIQRKKERESMKIFHEQTDKRDAYNKKMAENAARMVQLEKEDELAKQAEEKAKVVRERELRQARTLVLKEAEAQRAQEMREAAEKIAMRAEDKLSLALTMKMRAEMKKKQEEIKRLEGIEQAKKLAAFEEKRKEGLECHLMKQEELYMKDFLVAEAIWLVEKAENDLMATFDFDVAPIPPEPEPEEEPEPEPEEEPEKEDVTEELVAPKRRKRGRLGRQQSRMIISQPNPYAGETRVRLFLRKMAECHDGNMAHERRGTVSGSTFFMPLEFSDDVAFQPFDDTPEEPMESMYEISEPVEEAETDNDEPLNNDFSFIVNSVAKHKKKLEKDRLSQLYRTSDRDVPPEDWTTVIVKNSVDWVKYFDTNMKAATSDSILYLAGHYADKRSSEEKKKMMHEKAESEFLESMHQSTMTDGGVLTPMLSRLDQSVPASLVEELSHLEECYTSIKPLACGHVANDVVKPRHFKFYQVEIPNTSSSGILTCELKCLFGDADIFISRGRNIPTEFKHDYKAFCNASNNGCVRLVVDECTNLVNGSGSLSSLFIIGVSSYNTGAMYSLWACQTEAAKQSETLARVSNLVRSFDILSNISPTELWNNFPKAHNNAKAVVKREKEAMEAQNAQNNVFMSMIEGEGIGEHHEEGEEGVSGSVSNAVITSVNNGATETEVIDPVERRKAEKQVEKEQDEVNDFDSLESFALKTGRFLMKTQLQYALRPHADSQSIEDVTGVDDDHLTGMMNNHVELFPNPGVVQKVNELSHSITEDLDYLGADVGRNSTVDQVDWLSASIHGSHSDAALGVPGRKSKMSISHSTSGLKRAPIPLDRNGFNRSIGKPLASTIVTLPRIASSHKKKRSASDSQNVSLPPLYRSNSREDDRLAYTTNSYASTIDQQEIPRAHSSQSRDNGKKKELDTQFPAPVKYSLRQNSLARSISK